MKELPIDFLNECLDYNPDTGEFLWKERPKHHFSQTERGNIQKTWNTKWAGKVAGKFDKHGYRLIGINNTFYFSHRLAWAMHYGEWPDDSIDHINGIPSDNRICNLRIATPAEQNKNLPRWSKNKSGVLGVSWYKPARRWRVTCGDSSKSSSHIGSFKSFEEAVRARRKAEIERGYHPNHGRIQ